MYVCIYVFIYLCISISLIVYMYYLIRGMPYCI